MNYKILLVDDDIEILEVYKKIFSLSGFDVEVCTNAYNALELMKTEKIGVIVTDIIMPKMNGMELLKKIKTDYPESEVIMLTAEGSISQAVEAVKVGAFSYLVKPADIDELIANVRRAHELASVKAENASLKERLAGISDNRKFIGESKVAQELKEKASIIAKSDSTVLITGETGTGKEVIANMIHNLSARQSKPFVCVNCGALNENLIESELFGNEKGAYTGAEKQRKGRFEMADGGTLFFDEIAELSLSMQATLLRVLQDKKFERVGGSKTIKSDFRLIAATNKDLKKEVENGNFRADLYYRLNIIPIVVKPLRERKEDIPLIANAFIREYAMEMNKKVSECDDGIIYLLSKYDWPGNVRELRNVMERLVVMSQEGKVSKYDLPEELREMERLVVMSQEGKVSKCNLPEELREFDYDEKTEKDLTAGGEVSSLKEITKQFEREIIVSTLHECNGNVSKASEKLGIARKNLYRKMEEYKIVY